MGASMIQPCNGCNTVDYNGELDDAGRCAECVTEPDHDACPNSTPDSEQEDYDADRHASNIDNQDARGGGAL